MKGASEMKPIDLLILLTLTTLAAGEAIPINANLSGWNKTVPGVSVQNGTVTISVPDKLDSRGHLGIWKQFGFKQYAGKSVMVSVEMEGVNVVQNPGGQYGGAKLQVIYTDSGRKEHYSSSRPCFGSFDRQTVRVAFQAPESGVFTISLGTQMSTGTIRYRNLNIAEAAAAIDFSGAANMGFADPQAKDGIGGWSDQGADNDASEFDYSKPAYADIPFKIIDPAKNSGKSILAFRSGNFPGGLEKAKIPVGRKSACLYLLHTAAWCPQTGTVGEIRLEGKNGNQIIEVEAGRDIADQWNPVTKPNAFAAAKWNNKSGGSNGVYASRFQVDEKIGEIKTITFRPKDPSAVWLVVSALLSDMDYPFPVIENYRITENEIWKPLKRPENLLIAKDSALDFSFLNQDGGNERIVIRGGHFAFADAPEKPLRLYGFQISTFTDDYYTHLRGEKQFHSKGPWRDKKSIEQEVLQLTRTGANMVRVHLFNCLRVEDGKVVWDEEQFDALAWFLAKCRENHIYIQLDASHTNGFGKYPQWSSENEAKNFRFNLLFDPAAREEYRLGLSALLNRKNPYTGIVLKDDPTLAFLCYSNEQEFAFISEDKIHRWDKAADEWRKFSGNPDAPMFTRADLARRDESGRKANDFVMAKWRDMLAWYRKTVHGEIGYPGPGFVWDMTGSARYNSLRAELDMTMSHGYHAHPLGGIDGWGFPQGSDIGSSLNMFRCLIDKRIADLPFCVNEYQAYFWNRFRYEEAFTAAYASFQGFDSLVRHNSAVSDIGNPDRIVPWISANDPIAMSCFMQEALLYARGDVKEADRGIRLCFSEKSIRENQLWDEGVDGGQSRLALVMKLGLERTDGPKNNVETTNDLRIPMILGSKVMEHEVGYVSLRENRDSGFELSLFIQSLKNRGILPKDNRSRDRDTLESSTGELFVDAANKYMTVNTPRFQGMCAPAGNKAVLKDVVLENPTTNANLSVAAIQGDSAIADAGRLLLFIATNALNTDQVFENSSMVQVKKIGNNPTLIECGRFKVTIRNRNADQLKVYALAMNGERRSEIRPVSNSNGLLVLDIDTAKLPDGPALFFEIAAAHAR